MPRMLVVVAVCAFSAITQATSHAQSGDPADLFLNAYLAFQQGEKLEASGQYRAALSKYRYSGSVLEQLQSKNDKWQPLIVEYRRKKIAESISQLEGKLAQEDQQAPDYPTDAQGEVADAPLPEREEAPSVSVAPSEFSAPGDVQNRLAQLQEELKQSREQLRTVQREKEELASQLNDTMQQLNKAKVNDAELRSKVTQLEVALQNARADRDASDTKALRAEIERLRNMLADARADRDVADEETKEMSGRLSKARQQIASLEQERQSIAQERDKAVAELAEAKKAQEQVEKLIADNSSLMEKLAQAEKTIQDFKSETPEKDSQIANLRQEVGEVRQQLAAAQQQSQEYQTTIADLQAKLETANADLAKAKTSGASSEEMKQLAHENELLRGIVMRQLKDQARREQAKKLVLSELQKLEVQSDVLMQQIDYLGQPVVQLSDEEKALLKVPEVKMADKDESSMALEIAAAKPGASPGPTNEFDVAKANNLELASRTTPPTDFDRGTPSASPAPEEPKAAEQPRGESAPEVETTLTPKVPEELLPLARQAREHFEKGEYREAEKIYEKILSKVPNNLYALSNLGVVRFRAGKMKLAEEAFKKAIAVEPEDSFSRSTLGIVFYSQAKYDEAITELTKALAINPRNPTAHNYLGITASQKGWQEAARKELETAVALDPNYSDAHFNLAVIFATQQPPDKEQARRHYDKAVELGAEPDPALEQLIQTQMAPLGQR
jgi:Flp pilus assembly protein TadD/uncharacterized coiled-coil DUF342 family protein